MTDDTDTTYDGVIFARELRVCCAACGRETRVGSANAPITAANMESWAHTLNAEGWRRVIGGAIGVQGLRWCCARCVEQLTRARRARRDSKRSKGGAVS